MSLPRTAILGFGTMGRTLARGLLRDGLLAPADLRIAVTRPDRPDAEAAALGLVPQALAEAVAGADLIVLCVKPKDMETLCTDLAATGALATRPTVVSIAAGVPTAKLAAWLPGAGALVRAMPNTPCAIGQGATVLSAGPGATDATLAQVRRLFEPLGAVLDLAEKHMDAATGLSASGPAFIYVVLEAMAEGGVMRGLPRAVALELAARVMQGAAAMVLATGRHPASLKDDVTTPAGCTIAGLLALEDGRLRSVIARGVETAARVAGELTS